MKLGRQHEFNSLNSLMLLTWHVETKTIPSFLQIIPPFEDKSDETGSVNRPSFILILTTYPEAHF